MPRVTAFNLRKSDDLAAIEAALKAALVSLPEMAVAENEIDLVPVLAPDGFHATVTRIDVDLWEQSPRTKDALQEVATRMAMAFKNIVGADRRVKVVLRPYDVAKSGWVSL